MSYGYYEYVDLTPQQVLQKVSQKQIFEWIIGEPIIEGKLYKSPLREDGLPGCRFDTLRNGDILFTDFGDSIVRRSCWKMVMDYFGITLSEAIERICNAFKISKNSSDYEAIPIMFESSTEVIQRTEIYYERRKFKVQDTRYWNRYSITKKQLEEDMVYPAKRVIIINHKKRRSTSFRPSSICYAIDFSDAVKIYQPLNPEYKFITNCTIDHVGNLNNVTKGLELIIAKAYKDHRILRNLERPNTVWFPSENIIPSSTVLRYLCDNFTKIIIFFDNDYAGLVSALKLWIALNTIELGKAVIVFIPLKYGCKDLGDFLPKEGREDTLMLLKQLNL